ncbi:hypothetical protein N9D31_02400 [Oligoflexaceae bacterium]|nr:hypothetical protein [Oligoflexaceae bacterium]
MRRPILFTASFLLILPSCIKNDSTSTLAGVRVGNSKLVVCKYVHADLGEKRVEHYALYEARKNGLSPLSLPEAAIEGKSTKERDQSFQKMALDTIADLDPFYHGMLEGMLETFDSGETVKYEYANHIGDEEDQEEMISLPKDGFVTSDGKPVNYNPRYSDRLCDTELLIYRKSKEVGRNTFQVAMDRWDPTMDPESLVPPSDDIEPLDPKLDFLDYRGRVAAKLEDLLDSFELADPNDVITYVGNLLSGTFDGMSYYDYSKWKEAHGLSPAYRLDKRGHYYGTAQMRTVEFFQGTQNIKKAELTHEPYSKFKLYGLNAEMKVGNTEHRLTFANGAAEFNEDQSIKKIWGGIKYSHHDMNGKCLLNFDQKSWAEFHLDGGRVVSVKQATGVEVYSCLQTSHFVRVYNVSFDEDGNIKTMYVGSPADVLKDPNYKYEVEIMHVDGQMKTYRSGDVLTIENRRVLSSKRFNE